MTTWSSLVRVIDVGFILGLQDVKDKYIRSVFGPFWNTAALAVIVLAIGPLYGKIFGGYSEEYILYLAAGLVGWFYISSVMMESTSAFVSQAPHILQSNLPLEVYTVRIVIRNTLLLLHNLLIPVLIAIFLGKMNYYMILSLFLAVVTTSLALIPVAQIIAIISTRYRDVGHLVATLTQFAMFLTPVFWVPSESIIRESKYVIYNPFFYPIDYFRYPFEIKGSDSHLIFLVVFFLVFAVLSYFLTNKVRKKLVYWL